MVMVKTMEPSAAIRRMHAATTSMENALNLTVKNLDKLRAEHASTLAELERRYKDGYREGYRKAVEDVRRKMGGNANG